MKVEFKSVDEYIGSFPKEVQSTLNEIRKTILKNAPDTVESISYGMPAYKFNSKPLVYFAGYKNHIGFYATPTGHAEFKEDLSIYKQGKGSVQFPLDAVPLALIKRIVEFRVSETKLKSAKMTNWKKGRGKLGILQPLLGNWSAEADSPMGKVKCSRNFEKVLGDNYIKLEAIWDFGGKTYIEHAMYGIGEDGIAFWSFTSDGKNSTGKLADGTDIHPDAICFEAQMPAGLARMIYWPDAEIGFHWAVESRNKNGWNRFTVHHYKPTE